MAPLDPLLPGRAVAQALQAGQISPGQWLAAQRQRIASLNPSLRAYLSQTDDGPPSEPGSGAKSALWGMGFAIKDNIDLAGQVSHAGLAAYGAQPLPVDAGSDFCVRRRNGTFAAVTITDSNANSVAVRYQIWE